MEQNKQDKIWQHYQNEQSEVFKNNRPRVRHIMSLLSKNKSLDKNKILNIGVGDGWLEKQAKQAGWQVYSLDPDKESIQVLRNDLCLNQNQAKVGYIQDMPFVDNYFDVIVASELFEHLSDEILSKGLVEIKRILKEGGCLLGTVPAREVLSDLTVLCPACGLQFHKWGHVRSFNINSAKELLAKHFAINKIYEKCFITTDLNWKGKLNSYLKIILGFFNVRGSGENIIFIVNKK